MILFKGSSDLDVGFMAGDSSGGGERVAGGVDPKHPERRVVDHLARERTHHLLGKKSCNSWFNLGSKLPTAF